MNTRHFYILRFALAAFDLFLINICFYIGFYLSTEYGFAIENKIYTDHILLCSLLWLLCANLFNLYSESTASSLIAIRRATLRTVLLYGVLFLLYVILRYKHLPLYFFLTTYLSLIVTGIIMIRYTRKQLQNAFNRKFDFRKSVAILNISQGGNRLAEYLRRQRTLNFVGFLNTGLFSSAADKPKSVIAAEQLKAASDSGIEEVYVYVNPNELDDYLYLVEESDKHCMRLKFVPDIGVVEKNYSVDTMGDFKVLSPRREPLERMSNRFMKRCFDVTVSLFTIVFILSWLYPLLAAIIKFQSKGPILFKQRRTGRDNKSFWCYKFRSMYSDQSSESTKHHITPIGRFMRRTSLDEFPQFLNVLFGYMSIIGPRPHMTTDTEDYRKLIDKYMVRQFLKPGISGWAQVNGFRGHTAHTSQMESRVAHDLWYMENWTIALDIKIMLLTVKNIFKGEVNAF